MEVSVSEESGATTRAGQNLYLHTELVEMTRDTPIRVARKTYRHSRDHPGIDQSSTQLQ